MVFLCRVYLIMWSFHQNCFLLYNFHPFYFVNFLIIPQYSQQNRIPLCLWLCLYFLHILALLFSNLKFIYCFFFSQIDYCHENTFFVFLVSTHYFQNNNCSAYFVWSDSCLNCSYSDFLKSLYYFLYRTFFGHLVWSLFSK